MQEGDTLVCILFVVELSQFPVVVVVLQLLFPLPAYNLRAQSTMAQDLLNCTICPKQPTFSDTSHLLTHVSSKGHLSEWHKLQVRSFQDIAAGVALANYSLWCQQHDIDRLLSERMQMKEDKQARKRRATNTRNASALGPLSVDEALVDPPMPTKRAAIRKTKTQKKGSRVRQQEKYEIESDSDFSPVKRSK